MTSAMKDPMQHATAIVGTAVSIGAATFGTLSMALAVSSGALLALASLASYRFLVARMLEASAAGGLLGFKLVGTFAAFGGLVFGAGLDATGLIVGYSALPVGLLVGSAMHVPSLSSTET